MWLWRDVFYVVLRTCGCEGTCFMWFCVHVVVKGRVVCGSAYMWSWRGVFYVVLRTCGREGRCFMWFCVNVVVKGCVLCGSAYIWSWRDVLYVVLRTCGREGTCFITQNLRLHHANLTVITVLYLNKLKRVLLKSGFGGLGVSVLAFGTRVRGFKPGRSRAKKS